MLAAPIAATIMVAVKMLYIRDILGDEMSEALPPPRTGPHMETYGPYTARTMWQLYRAVDWTYMHHEQTYHIMADKGIPGAIARGSARGGRSAPAGMARALDALAAAQKDERGQAAAPTGGKP